MSLRASLVFFVLAFAGCGILTNPYGSMTPEQIGAAVKDKSSTVACAKGFYAGTTVTIIHANADKGVPGTTIIVEESCKTTLTTEGRK